MGQCFQCLLDIMMAARFFILAAFSRFSPASCRARGGRRLLESPIVIDIGDRTARHMASRCGGRWEAPSRSKIRHYQLIKLEEAARQASLAKQASKSGHADKQEKSGKMRRASKGGQAQAGKTRRTSRGGQAEADKQRRTSRGPSKGPKQRRASRGVKQRRAIKGVKQIGVHEARLGVKKEQWRQED